MITEIDAKLLEKIADLTGKPAGAFNIRKDMGCEARQSTEHITIDPRADGKPGIDIHFKAGTKGETCHIPVIISQTGMSDMVYNDFYVADDCDVNIVAGCGTTPAVTKAATTASTLSTSAETAGSTTRRSITARTPRARPAKT